MNDENKEILDSETQDVSGDDNAEESYDSETSSETQTDEEIEKARQIASDQKRRAEKAERELKELKAKLEIRKTESKSEKTDGQSEKSDESNNLTKEEVILFAKGLNQEQVDKAVSIAKIEGVNPLVAAESEYFKFWKTEQEKKTEAENTQLGASKGSAKSKPKKDFATPGITSEDHKALWREKMGR